MEVFVQVPLDRDAFEDDELREEDGSEEGDERRERDGAQGGSADGEAESEGGLLNIGTAAVSVIPRVIQGMVVSRKRLIPSQKAVWKKGMERTSSSSVWIVWGLNEPQSMYFHQ